MPELVSSVDDCRTLRDTGVVHENIDVANPLKHQRDTLRISNIADDCDRFVANLLSDLFDLLRSSRSDGDTNPFTSEGEGNRATDASAAASNQSCFNHG